MSQRNYPSVRIKNFQHDCVLIAGQFRITLGGAGPILVNSVVGNGFTVAWTAAGRFTITTDDTYRHVVCCQAEFAAATPTDRFIAPAVPGGGAGAAVTWELDLWDIGGAGVVTPAANTDEIHFWMILSNSQLDRAAW